MSPLSFTIASTSLDTVLPSHPTSYPTVPKCNMSAGDFNAVLKLALIEMELRLTAVITTAMEKQSNDMQAVLKVQTDLMSRVGRLGRDQENLRKEVDQLRASMPLPQIPPLIPTGNGRVGGGRGGGGTPRTAHPQRNPQHPMPQPHQQNNRRRNTPQQQSTNHFTPIPTTAAGGISPARAPVQVKTPPPAHRNQWTTRGDGVYTSDSDSEGEDDRNSQGSGSTESEQPKPVVKRATDSVVPAPRPVTSAATNTTAAKPTGGFGAGRKGRAPASQKPPVCPANPQLTVPIKCEQTHAQEQSENDQGQQVKHATTNQSEVKVKEEDTAVETSMPNHVEEPATPAASPSKPGIPTRQLTMEELGVLSMVMMGQ